MGRRRDLLERLPSASVAIALLLLAFAPSKWIWHFGVFTGLAVVAIGLDPTGSTVAASRARGWVAAGVVLAVSFFAASDVEAWGPLDGSGVNWDTIPFLALTAATVSSPSSSHGYVPAAPSVAPRRSSRSPSPSR